MPKNRKYFRHDTALLVTSRTEEGLPMVPTHFLNEIIWGILARGRSLYQVKICHFVFMANHFHMLIVVDNPEDVSNFVGYVKAEIAHAINKLLGRRQKTIWSKGYDSPIILTSKDVIKYINYIYSNPVKANLVDSIEDFPGVSSWEMFNKDHFAQEYKKFSRDSIPVLAFASNSINEQKEILSQLLSEKTLGTRAKFVLEPYAWTRCFVGYRNLSYEKIKTVILESINHSENRLRERRNTNKIDVIGSTALRRQSMLKEYSPSKFSKRMICISSDIDLRKRFIDFFRAICSYASKVYLMWKQGEVNLRIPAGLYAPKVPVLASDMTRVT